MLQSSFCDFRASCICQHYPNKTLKESKSSFSTVDQKRSSMVYSVLRIQWSGIDQSIHGRCLIFGRRIQTQQLPDTPPHLTVENEQNNWVDRAIQIQNEGAKNRDQDILLEDFE